MADTADETTNPTPEDEARFWLLLETSWDPLGPEINQLRRELANRVPDAPVDVVDLEDALSECLANLAQACAVLSTADLINLDRVVERKLFDLDRSDIHAVTDGSDDGFLYGRGFIVAMGQEFYEAVLREPELAGTDGECEEICYFFTQYYRDRVGEDFPGNRSGISRESFSNGPGWLNA